MQHDAHEFFNHLLNSIHLVLLEEKKAELEKKRLIEQHGAIGTGIKKDRASIFSRKKGKSLKQNSSINAGLKSSIDASFPTENSSSAVPQSESVCSVESQHTADDTDLSTTGNDPDEKPKLMNEKTFGGSASNISVSGSKNASFSLLNRIRQSKKVSTSSKSSEENDCANTSPKQKDLVAEDGKTWIYDIFQGTYTTITRCLNCETVSSVFFFIGILNFFYSIVESAMFLMSFTHDGVTS